MSYTHFSKTERLEISVLLKRGCSHREIGSALGKHHSSVSREIKNNSVNGRYDPNKADHKSYVKRKYAKYQRMKIRSNQKLEKYVQEKMKCFWSPETIAVKWNKEFGKQENIAINAPSIYKYLYSSFGQDLCGYLFSMRHRKKKRKGKKIKRQIIPNRVSIEERPDIINNRLEFGHFEGDTLGRIKTDKEAIAGMSERMSRYVLLKKVSRLKYTIDGFSQMLSKHRGISQSLTLDNGMENKRHEELKTRTYFCHPYSPYEKGSIENVFKRLRRFIPKKSSLANYTDNDIAKFADILNNIPLKCLDYKTPKEVFEEQYVLERNKQIHQQVQQIINRQSVELNYQQCRA